MNIQWRISQSEAGKFMQTCEAIIRNVDGGTKAATTEACIDILNLSMAQCPVDTGSLISTGDFIVERRQDINGYRYQGIIGYAGFSTVGLSGSSSVTGTYKEGSLTPIRDVKTINGRTTYGANHGAMSYKSDHIKTNIHGYGGRGSALVHSRAGARITSDRINPKSGLPVSAYSVIVHEDLSMPHPRGGKAKFLEDPVREYGQAKFQRVAETHWRWAIEFVKRQGYNRYGRLSEYMVPAYSLVKLTPTQADPHGPRGTGPVL